MFYTVILQYVINTEEWFAPDNSNAYMSQNKLSFETSPLNTLYMLMLRQLQIQFLVIEKRGSPGKQFILY